MAIAKTFSQALGANFQKLSMHSRAGVEQRNGHFSEKIHPMLLHVTVFLSFVFKNRKNVAGYFMQ